MKSVLHVVQLHAILMTAKTKMVKEECAQLFVLLSPLVFVNQAFIVLVPVHHVHACSVQNQSNHQFYHRYFHQVSENCLHFFISRLIGSYALPPVVRASKRRNAFFQIEWISKEALLRMSYFDVIKL